MKQNTILYTIIALLIAFLGYNYMQQNKPNEVLTTEKADKVNQSQVSQSQVNQSQVNQSQVNQSQNKPKSNQTQAQASDMTKKVQHALRKVGYKVPTDGIIEERTIGSIKDFEEKNGLIITGKADSVMLEELQLAYGKLDQQAWQTALDSNTVDAFNQYQESYADGTHVQEVADKITQLNDKIAKQQQQQKQQAAAKKEKQQKAAKLARQRQAKEKKLAGTTHKDCPNCPTMVYIPSGGFNMGSNERDSEKPIHKVNIKGFYMGQTEVTFSQWYTCHNEGGCRHTPDDEDWGTGSRPVINVNWNDAQQYVAWLNHKTGKKYRLPSESEWEYAARAGSTTKYSMGNSISCGQARYDCGEDKTARVKSFSANNFGLYDMHGNVWEWVEDKWHANYSGAPSNGSAWINGDSSHRVLRGGSWYGNAGSLRIADRNYNTPSDRNYIIGFRLAQDK